MQINIEGDWAIEHTRPPQRIFKAARTSSKLLRSRKRKAEIALALSFLGYVVSVAILGITQGTEIGFVPITALPVTAFLVSSLICWHIEVSLTKALQIRQDIRFGHYRRYYVIDTDYSSQLVRDDEGKLIGHQLEYDFLEHQFAIEQDRKLGRKSNLSAREVEAQLKDKLILIEVARYIMGKQDLLERREVEAHVEAEKTLDELKDRYASETATIAELSKSWS